MEKNKNANVRRNSSHWMRLLRDGVIRFGFYFLLCALSLYSYILSSK